MIDKKGAAEETMNMILWVLFLALALGILYFVFKKFF
jgi:hypothetical protein